MRWWLAALVAALSIPVFPEDETAFVVHLDRQQQRLAGIQSRVLPPPRPMPSQPAWAYVLDPAPVIQQTAEYHQLRHSRGNALKEAQVLQDRYRRLHRLGNGIKRRELEQAEVAWLEAENRSQTLAIQLAGMRQRILNRWGSALGQWMLEQSSRLQQLADGRITLVRLVTDRPGPAQLIYRNRRIPLNYLSLLPGADPLLKQPAALFWAEGWIPYGLRLQALTGKTIDAVAVPATAVIWYASGPWIYLQTGAETFQRHILENWQVSGDTWWVNPELGGHRIVVRGAQLLLAEEFRALVPEEDDD